MNTAVKAYIYYVDFHTVPNSKDKNVHAVNCLYNKLLCNPQPLCNFWGKQ